jgi:AraC-like DNA-binding protein
MISASYLVALEWFAASRGLVARCDLEPLDIDFQNPSQSEPQVSCVAFIALLERLAELADDEAFCLEFIETLPPRPSGVLQNIVMNSRTLRDAFQAIARFLVLITDAFQIRYEESDGCGWMVYDFPNTSEPRTQFIDGQMALIALRARELCGDACKPVHVEMERDRPTKQAALAQFKKAFGIIPKFNQHTNRIGFSLADLVKPLPSANLGLYASAHDYAKQLLGINERDQIFSNSVARFIASALPRGHANETRACAELGVSMRTMQRNLASEGTTFKALLEETRMRMARHFLVNTDLSLTAIAFMLGYSELSAFSRAAKSWHGDSPSALRRKFRALAH